ncbi:MAG: response regulator [Magnetococcales bacterium]|nr:response regulator [Magnetococcales bacterium]
MSSDPGTPHSPGPLATKKLKTLIVDDHPASILLLQDMLTDCCECFAATGGPQAIALFEKALRDGKSFDIILLDIEMPGMSGIDVLKELRLRELDWRKQNLLFEDRKFARIIMQTASDNPQDLFDAYLKGKCNGYINKPFHKKDLLDKILVGS